MKSSPVIMAFTDEQVSRLTGITKKQLSYWDRTGFFEPSLAEDNRRQSYSRIYTFRDVANLQVLFTLRNEVRIPLQHLREVKQKLTELGDKQWTETTLFVLNRRVVFKNPETGSMEDAVSGQGVLQIPLQVIKRNLEDRVEALWQRTDDDFGKISQHRSVVRNKPVISGTRIPTKSIVAFHEDGYSIQNILKEYPSLTENDVRAAIAAHKAA